MTNDKIATCLWFDFNAEEAVKHYVGIFPNSKILSTSYYNEAVPEHKGKVLLIEFELAGRPFQALNGGPQFPFTEAVSLSIDCADQKEIDHYWSKLTQGGQEVQCGWLKDKFGLSWQVASRELLDLWKGPAHKAAAGMRAMFDMKKLDIGAIKRAYDQA